MVEASGKTAAPGRVERFVIAVLIAAAPCAALAEPALRDGDGRKPAAAAQDGGGRTGKKEAPGDGDKGWLGVEVRTLASGDEGHGAASQAGQGVRVMRVLEGSPASGSLVPGDVLLAVDGRAIESARGFFAVVGGKNPGREISLAVSRAGKQRVVAVKLGVRPEAKTEQKDPAPAAPSVAAGPAPAAAPPAAPPIHQLAEKLPAEAGGSADHAAEEFLAAREGRTPPAVDQKAEAEDRPAAAIGAHPGVFIAPPEMAPGGSASGPPLALKTTEGLPPPAADAGTESAGQTAAAVAEEEEGRVAYVQPEGAGSPPPAPGGDAPEPSLSGVGGDMSPASGDAVAGPTALAATETEPGFHPGGVCDGVVVLAGLAGLEEGRCLKPGGGQQKGQSFRDCPSCPEMVIAPAGSFMMGSPRNEAGDLSSGTPEHNRREDPQHLVEIPRPFAVGRFSVTFEEWDACAMEGGCGEYRPDDKGWGRGRRPVINVSWGDARAYVKWLGHKTGKAYRLLSEAEREYVARAGTITAYWWGATAATAHANFGYDSTNGETHVFEGEPAGEFRNQTLPVSDLAPNPWGLHHVHGNVAEWGEDCWHDSYKGKPEDLKRTGGAWRVGDCFYRIRRGGAWDDRRIYLRSASRSFGEFDDRAEHTGFRVARDLAP